MSNYKSRTQVKNPQKVSYLDDKFLLNGGINDFDTLISVSGGDVDLSGIESDIATISGDVILVSGEIAMVSSDLAAVSGDLQNVSNDLTTLSGNLQIVSNDLSALSGTVDTAISDISTVSGDLNTVEGNLATLQATINDLLSHYTDVINQTEKLYTTPATVVLTTSGAGDLNSAIAALTDGDVLELQTSAVFSPITIPSGVAFQVKVADGYFPSITGSVCIKVSNGAADVLISSLIIENCTTTYSNGIGSAIGFLATQSKVQDIIFHNLTIRNAQASAVILAYHSDDSYAVAPTLEQMSKRISFVGCHLHKATNDLTEGAAITLRGVDNAFITGCYVDSISNGRGIQLQDCINSVIEDNYVSNCDGNGNGEGIKLDLMGTASGYRNTAIIRNNVIKRCIEGIDIDDASSCSVIQGNIISECSGEAISLDGGTPNGVAAIIGNTCYKNNIGIRLEAGSVGNLKKNVCYNNTTNYLIENGYVVDDSNTTALDDCFEVSFASLVKNDSTVSGALVSDALTELQETKQTIEAGTVRPGSPITGQSFFDLTLGKPIWYNVTVTGWVDSTGTLV